MYELHTYDYNACGYVYWATCSSVEEANQVRSELCEQGWFVEIKPVSEEQA
jgi:hypothetical protein